MPTKPKPKPKPTPTPTPTYSWIMNPQGVTCFTSPAANCTVLTEGLWEVETVSPFHDEALQSATKEINTILEEVQKSKPDKDLYLSFVAFQNRPFLVWTRADALTPDNDDTAVAEALGLTKPKRPARKR